MNKLNENKNIANTVINWRDKYHWDYSDIIVELYEEMSDAIREVIDQLMSQYDANPWSSRYTEENGKKAVDKFIELAKAGKMSKYSKEELAARYYHDMYNEIADMLVNKLGFTKDYSEFVKENVRVIIEDDYPYRE